MTRTGIGAKFGAAVRRNQGVLFVLPAVVTLAAVLAFPLCYVVYLSFFEDTGIGLKPVGLANYGALASDPVFWTALLNSTLFAAGSVALHFVIGLAIALVLNAPGRLRRALRVTALVPWMLAPVVVGVTWQWIYSSQFGVLNFMLMGVGLIDRPVAWLADQRLAMSSVVAASAWRGFPIVMLMLLAGLQAIPVEQYEAATVDGASRFQRFLYVTLPNLRYIAITAVTLDAIWMFRHFDLIQVMTRGGPGVSTEVLVTFIYKQVFQNFRLGYASAAAVVMCVLLCAFTMSYVRRVLVRS